MKTGSRRTFVFLLGLVVVATGAACGAAAGGADDAAGAADEPAAPPPPCDDGDPCTLEERTAAGCRIRALDPACDADGGSGHEAAAVCCEVDHPDGGRVRFPWSYAPCLAAAGAPFIPADCIGVPAVESVCCALPREDGADLGLFTSRTDCGERGGAVVLDAVCARATAPVCCTTPVAGAEGEAPAQRTLIVTLPECLAVHGAAAPQDRCDPACERPCASRDCGPDGCGGSCGECHPDLVCTPIGTCELTAEPGGTVCCVRSTPDGAPRERRLATPEDCAAGGGAAEPLAACGEPLPQPAADDVCCEWPVEGAACTDHADCGTDACAATPFGGTCSAPCASDDRCPVGRACRAVEAGAPEYAERVCRPARLWWPPGACAASGGAAVSILGCQPERTLLVCCALPADDGSGGTDYAVLGESHCVAVGGEPTDDAPCADLR